MRCGQEESAGKELCGHWYHTTTVLGISYYSKYHTTLCTDITQTLCWGILYCSVHWYHANTGSAISCIMYHVYQGYIHVDRNITLHCELWISYNLGYHKSVLIWYNHCAEDIIQPGISTYHTTLGPYPLMDPLHSYILYHRNITKALGILWMCSHPSSNWNLFPFEKITCTRIVKAV